VLQLGREGHWEVVTSSLAVEEARRNLEAKFPSAVAHRDAIPESIALVPTVIEESCPTDLPKKDAPIFLSAAGSRCTHLLTGDRKDFGRFMNAPKKTSGIVIQTVAEFLAAIDR
jgi:hypothetical protein